MTKKRKGKHENSFSLSNHTGVEQSGEELHTKVNGLAKSEVSVTYMLA